MFDPQPLHISKLEVYHPEYLKCAPTWRTIKKLMEGYTAIADNPQQFLPKRPGEDEELYALRLAKLAYTPLMSSVVNRYAGKLASAKITLADDADSRLELFRKSCGVPGKLKQNEKALIGSIFRHLLQYARVWVTVDTNKLDYVPLTAYDESLLLGAVKPYCYVLDPLTVTQWGDGWHITRDYVQTVAPFATTSYKMVYSYHDKATIVTYAAEVQLKTVTDLELNSYQAVQRVKVGEEWLDITDPLAVVQVYSVHARDTQDYNTVSLTLPDEQWLCKQIYAKQIQHLRLETSWTDTGYLAGTIQRVYTPVDPLPMEDTRAPMEKPDYTQELAKAGNAHILIGKGYQFVESSGNATQNQQQMLDKIEEQIWQLAALHFASGKSKGALQQSGASKQVDMSLLDDTLSDYGDYVLTLYNSILSLVCGYLGAVPTEAQGLDEFQDLELNELILLLGTVGNLPTMPLEMLLALYNKLMELAKIDVLVNTPLVASNILDNVQLTNT